MLINCARLFLRRSTGCCARDGRAVFRRMPCKCGGLVRRIPWKNRRPKRSGVKRFITTLVVFFMPFFTYILISSNSGNYYFGHCKNLSIRLAQHNSGKVRSTKARRPWTLHYYEEFHAKSEAYKREQFFKSFDGRKWLYEKEIFKRAD